MILLDRFRVCLGFMRRLPKDQMFFSTLNICFKAGLLQTTRHPSVRSLTVIYTNYQREIS